MSTSREVSKKPSEEIIEIDGDDEDDDCTPGIVAVDDDKADTVSLCIPLLLRLLAVLFVPLWSSSVPSTDVPVI